MSRADLCSDFIGWIPREADLCRFVTRSRLRSEYFAEAEEHFERRQLTGFRFGKGDLVARLYDKTAEIKSSGKMWPWELWGPESARETVWRIEFQFRRAVLGEFSVSGLGEVLKAERDLWDYGTKWLSLRDSSSNQQPYRWPVAREWSVIASTRVETPAQGLIRGRIHRDDLDSQLRSIAGHLTSVGAILGIPDKDRVLEVVGAQLVSFGGKDGLTFADAVRRKAARRVSL